MRKTQWKRVLVGALAVSMIAGNCAPAFAATSGWKQNNTGWWYQNTNGTYKTNTWFQDGSDWYYFDGNGYMVTGWAQDSTMHWYYMNPVSNGKMGVMKTGWVQDGDKWYYLNPLAGGTLQTGWINDGGKWYFADSNGAMQTGVISVDGVVYYLNPNSDGTKGAMMVGTYTIDGKTYTFGENGAPVGIAPAATVIFNSNGTTVNAYASTNDNSSSSSGGGSSYSSSSTKKGNEYKNGDLYIRKAGTIDQEALEKLGVKNGEVDNVYISSSVGDKDVTIDDLTINGNVFVRGGGSNTVVFKSCRVLGTLTTDKSSGEQVRVKLEGFTTIAKILIEKSAKIEISSDNVIIKAITIEDTATIRTSDGVKGAEIPTVQVETTKKIEIEAPVTTLQVNKSNKQVVINTTIVNVVINKQSNITLSDNASIVKIEVNKDAGNTSITKSENATIDVIVADANCSVPSDTKVEITNENIVIKDSANDTEITDSDNIGVVERYSLTIDSVENATASLDRQLVSDKEKAILTIVPDAGYRVTEVTAGEADVAPLTIEDGVVTTVISNVKEDTEIKIKVEEIKNSDNEDNDDTETTTTETTTTETATTETTTTTTTDPTDSTDEVSYAIKTGDVIVTGSAFSGGQVTGSNFVYTITVGDKTVTDSAIDIKALKGEKVSIKAELVLGNIYMAKSLIVKTADGEIANSADGTVSFGMPDKDVTIDVEFEVNN